jgi:RNA polymerase primary sigma factor
MDAPAPNDGDQSALTLYLREIGQVKLLSAEEQWALARRARRGDTAAREELIKANLRLVVKIAQDYSGYGLPLLDLISEGNIGLMKAVDRFDPSRGVKLSAYAAFWIKQAVRRALANQTRTVRLPVHVHDKLLRLNRIASRLRDLLGHEPTEEELADEAGLSVKRLRKLRAATRSFVSLDQPRSEDDPTTVGESVPDPNALAPGNLLDLADDRARLGQCLGDLSDRERLVLMRRYGLNGESVQTLEDTGRECGVTRERVRQIQTQAIKKLRARFLECELAKAV